MGEGEAGPPPVTPAPYRVVLTLTARSMLAAITDRRRREQIRDRFDGLAANPDRQGKALLGELKGYRSLRAAGQQLSDHLPSAPDSGRSAGGCYWPTGGGIPPGHLPACPAPSASTTARLGPRAARRRWPLAIGWKPEPIRKWAVPPAGWLGHPAGCRGTLSRWLRLPGNLLTVP